MRTDTIFKINDAAVPKNVNEKLYYRTTGFNATLYLLLFAFTISNSTFNLFSQTPGEWTWMHGDYASNIEVYGTKGIPSPSVQPAGLYEPVEWTDLNGNFWLYGGVDIKNGIMCSNMWKFDPATNQWTWMQGPGNVFFEPPVFGVKGVPSAVNTPGARSYGTPSWTDKNGDLWLFGGASYNSTDGQDLWKYDVTTNEWTWMHGDSVFYRPGIYGTKGVSSPLNLPQPRMETSCAWTDNSGNFWLFGGYGIDSLNSGALNDLWKFDHSINEWTWMHGSDKFDQSGVYGNKGIAASANTPGARWIYAHWKDLAGNLWLYGGLPFDSTGLGGNDMWKYNVNTGEWSWMWGDTVSFSDHYGNKCMADNLNTPPMRGENRACWTDACGNFWFCGGDYFNDLWYFNVAANEWKWISGDQGAGPNPIYGTKGVSAPGNKPGQQSGSVGWLDKNGYLWLFAGYDLGGNGITALWRYVPDADCTPVCLQCNTTVDAGNNVSIIKGSSTILNTSGGIAYSWSPASSLSCGTCRDPVASPTITTIYYLTVMLNDSCFAYDSVIVTVDAIALPCTDEVFVPSAFSPNDDGQNDALFVYGKCISEIDFTIYDRWGNKVFETNDRMKGWDGSYKGKAMNEAIFTYQMNAVLQNAEQISKKGNISLLK